MILRQICETDYTCIPNDILRRSNLSLQARSLLCIMLSLPDNWNFTIAGLCSFCPKNGRDSISAALRELEEERFLFRERSRRSNGTVGDAIWTVSSKPMQENPIQENPMLSSNNDIKYQVNQVKKDRGHAPTRSRFVPPSVVEVRAYCQERHNNVDAQRFVDYYAASGWKRGKTPIKDWRACVRTWEQRDKQTGRKSAGHDYRAYQEESL